MKISLLRVLLCSMTLCLCAANALADDWADDSIITTVLDPQGQTVFSLCASVNEGDEYISQDNTLYRIIISGKCNSKNQFIYQIRPVN